MSSFWNSPAWTMAKRSNNKSKAAHPGPGNYSSSSNIGRHNPAWKIGGAPRDSNKILQAPGPGDYNLQSSKSGPKITMSSKPKTNSLGETLAPGPGNYNLNTNFVYKNTSAFTMGSKYGNKVEDPEPGPGAYTANNQFKHNGPKIGTSKRAGVDVGNQNPGPGQYTYSRPFSAGPLYGFGNQMKSNATLDQRPGPGQYQVNQNSRLKGCKIGQKFTKKGNAFTELSAPGPGTYEVLKRPMSGTKIGKAERIKIAGTISPGPGAYDFNAFKSKSNNQIKIGTSVRSNFSKNGTPGPGSYQFFKGPIKGVTISGSKGKDQFELGPGPGTYELHQNQQRPCSAKIGKSLRSNLTIGDTPGPGQYNPKEKHNYQFAYSKEPRSKDLKGGDPGPGHYQIPSTVPSAPHYLLDPGQFKSYG